MSRKNERTLKMIEGFMKKHEEGLTIPEIAKFFQISVYTIYGNLQSIADANGTTRSELLTIVHNGYNRVDKLDNIIKIDVSEWQRKMQETTEQFSNNEKTMAVIMKQIERETEEK